MARKAKRAAVVRCAGGPAPDGRCDYGCVGCAACIGVCPKGAIDFDDNFVARVDRGRCIGCGLCARACPQGVIEVVPVTQRFLVLCSNPEPAGAARKECGASCIACGACERSCTCGAMAVQGNLAHMDLAACISCGMCAGKCPRGVIHDVCGIVAAGV